MKQKLIELNADIGKCIIILGNVKITHGDIDRHRIFEYTEALKRQTQPT